MKHGFYVRTYKVKLIPPDGGHLEQNRSFSKTTVV